MTVRATTPADDAEILTINESAAVLRVGVNAVYELVKRADFPAFRIGRTWRVPRAQLEQWISEQTRGES